VSAHNLVDHGCSTCTDAAMTKNITWSNHIDRVENDAKVRRLAKGRDSAAKQAALLTCRQISLASNPGASRPTIAHDTVCTPQFFTSG
jgi:hypothetical protein